MFNNQREADAIDNVIRAERKTKVYGRPRYNFLVERPGIPTVTLWLTESEAESFRAQFFGAVVTRVE